MSKALVGVCTGGPVALPDDPFVRTEFVDAVRHHRVAPLAHVRVRDGNPELAEALRDDRESALAMYVQSSAVLASMGQILGQTPWVTFKGPVLSEHAHPVPGLRNYNDIDVLVSASAFRDVTTRLRTAGWQVVDRDDMLRNHETPGEMHWISPAGVLLDLHWSMINMAAVRRRFPVTAAELLASRVHTTVGLSTAWTLSPADTVVHTCLHAALTGAHRMYLLLDADQLARTTPNWDAVVSRAQRWGAAPAVALVLARAQRVLGTPLPATLMRSLGVTSSLRALARATDWISPVPALRTEASLAKLVARSVRPSGSRTVATLGARSMQGAINRLRRPSPPVPWDDRAPATEDSLEAYLRAVEADAARQNAA